MTKINTFKVIGEWPHVASGDFMEPLHELLGSVLGLSSSWEYGVLPVLPHICQETTKTIFSSSGLRKSHRNIVF